MRSPCSSVQLEKHSQEQRFFLRVCTLAVCGTRTEMDKQVTFQVYCNLFGILSHIIRSPDFKTWKMKTTALPLFIHRSSLPTCFPCICSLSCLLCTVASHEYYCTGLVQLHLIVQEDVVYTVVLVAWPLTPHALWVTFWDGLASQTNDHIILSSTMSSYKACKELIMRDDSECLRYNLVSSLTPYSSY